MSQSQKQPDCNTDLITDTAKLTGESEQQVRQAVNFFTEFIADTISNGAFETVIVPYFGKFQPKVRELQWKSHLKGVEKGNPIKLVKIPNRDGTV